MKLMKATTKCYCKSELSRVFNFTILCYLRNSQKLDARKKLVFYSNQATVDYFCLKI